VRGMGGVPVDEAGGAVWRVGLLAGAEGGLDTRPINNGARTVGSCRASARQDCNDIEIIDPPRRIIRPRMCLSFSPAVPVSTHYIYHEALKRKMAV
jgi:hypothetical protein